MDEKQPKVDTSAVGNPENPASTVPEPKGKGKAPPTAPEDVEMEEDDSSDEETGAEDEVRRSPPVFCIPHALIQVPSASRRTYVYPIPTPHVASI